MSRLTDEQRAHLKSVGKKRTQWQRHLKTAANARSQLDNLLVEGAQKGISTHRLAHAAGLSQPRVHQILKESQS